jgi:hypothetical protein
MPGDQSETIKCFVTGKNYYYNFNVTAENEKGQSSTI